MVERLATGGGALEGWLEGHDTLTLGPGRWTLAGPLSGPLTLEGRPGAVVDGVQITGEGVALRLLEVVGLEVDGGRARLTDCSVSSDAADLPAVWVEGGSLTLEGCALSGPATAAVVSGGGALELVGCTVRQTGEAGGDGLVVLQGALVMQRCEVRGARGVGLRVRAGGEAGLSECRLVQNDRGSERPSDVAVEPGGRLRLSRCEVGLLDGEPAGLGDPADASALLRGCVDAGRPDVALVALAAGADPATRGEEGRCVLHTLAMWGRAEALRVLLAGGVDPELADDNGCTAVHFAADGEVVRALAEGGADLFARDRQGGGALHSRATWADVGPAARALVVRGLAPDALDALGEHPVSLAIDAGQGDNVAALVALGADPDLPLPDGRTPLGVFAAAAERALVDTLLELGADPVRRDAMGIKPKQHAKPHRILRRTFDRLRDEPWQPPPLALSLAGLVGRRALSAPSRAWREQAARWAGGVLHPDVEAWMALTAATPAIRTAALTLDGAAPAMARGPLPLARPDGSTPLLPIGRDPFGREAVVSLDSGRLLCLRRGDLEALVAAGRAQGEADPVAWLTREAATLTLQEAVGLLALLGDRRAMELALSARRVALSRGLARRSADWLRPWIPWCRGRYEDGLVERRDRLAQRLAGVRPGPGAFYHPLEVEARWGLEDPLHPLVHELFDATRGVESVDGLPGWAAVAPLGPGAADGPRVPTGDGRWLDLVEGVVLDGDAVVGLDEA